MQLDLFAPRARHSSGAQPPTVFVRHRWARRYILRMLDDGTLRVTLPRWGSKREALAFVERSAPWIAQQLVKHQSRPVVVRPDEPALRRQAARELPVAPQSMASPSLGPRFATSDRAGDRAPRAARSPSTGA
jgi:predicted metal-dependent hydrolase